MSFEKSSGNNPISYRESQNTPWGATPEVVDNTYRKVLDHGSARLVDKMGSDLSIVRSARVSYNAAWRAGTDSGSDERLIRYLLRNGHTSPFEHVVFTFDVKAPIFVLRQWMRHRTWSYNEVSARYTELPRNYYIPELDQITTQSSDNKQMRTSEPNKYDLDIRDELVLVSNISFDAYDWLLERGCPSELARMVLPLNTYSHMFATVDLHNLFKFIKERTSPGAQYEIKVYAEALLELIRPVVPIAVKAWEDINYNDNNGAALAAKGV